jgi:PadR family transcriptional regulator, regulatory protein PadR
MKGERMGEFEELVLLTVAGLGKEAYGVSIQQRLDREAERDVQLGPVYSALDRLYRKGMVRTWVGGVTGKRGGRRKRYFEITKAGAAALDEARRVRRKLRRKAARSLKTLEAGA